mgnify:CR=1 FL=1
MVPPDFITLGQDIVGAWERGDAAEASKLTHGFQAYVRTFGSDLGMIRESVTLLTQNSLDETREQSASIRWINGGLFLAASIADGSPPNADCHSSWSQPSPCKKTSGLPSPFSATCIRMPFVSSVRWRIISASAAGAHGHRDARCERPARLGRARPREAAVHRHGAAGRHGDVRARQRAHAARLHDERDVDEAARMIGERAVELVRVEPERRFELRGGTVLPNGSQEVHQRIFKEGGGFSDRLAGTFTYHPEHDHDNSSVLGQFGCKAAKAALDKDAADHFTLGANLA